MHPQKRYSVTFRSLLHAGYPNKLSFVHPSGFRRSAPTLCADRHHLLGRCAPFSMAVHTTPLLLFTLSICLHPCIGQSSTQSFVQTGTPMPPVPPPTRHDLLRADCVRTLNRVSKALHKCTRPCSFASAGHTAQHLSLQLLWTAAGHTPTTTSTPATPAPPSVTPHAWPCPSFACAATYILSVKHHITCVLRVSVGRPATRRWPDLHENTWTK